MRWSMKMTRIRAVFLLGLGLAATAGCDRTPPTSPTPTNSGVTSVTQVFSGTLAPGGTGFVSYRVRVQ